MYITLQSNWINGNEHLEPTLCEQQWYNNNKPLAIQWQTTAYLDRFCNIENWKYINDIDDGDDDIKFPKKLQPGA